MDVRLYIQSLFEKKGIAISGNRQDEFDKFARNESNVALVEQITINQNKLMKNWALQNRILDIIDQQVSLPNAIEGKEYSYTVDLKKNNLADIVSYEIDRLLDFGLNFDISTNTITGIPDKSGDFKIIFKFKIDCESEEEPLHSKSISLLVNPDPKTLWKDIPSDQNALFWKDDNSCAFSELGEKHIVVASKRGRSHKNAGTFRDDDYAFKHIEKNGWSVVAVADGAGSYSLSRKGSEVSCKSIVEFFENDEAFDADKEFELKIQEYISSKDEDILLEAKNLSKQILYKATVFVHKKIKELAEDTYKSNPELFDNPKAKSFLDYFHSTLIFALFKKYDFGYLILTFGVGDCPIALISRENTVTLLNWLDVGEFGGGTRFITQPEIFHSNEHPMATRFNFQEVADFSYLFLMTDGIYDPKFVVEANLERDEKWAEFIDDLNGNNEDKATVEMNPSNTEISQQLSDWMDFWSTGNHDDRTLAIIF
ncbi:MAG: PP2C family serine/threonine-protein phosphatase [Dysgonomonas sp.]